MDKKNTHKLTKQQIKLIENNYLKIVLLLNKFLKNPEKRSQIFNRFKNNDLISEAISYIPDVTIEYNSNLTSIPYHLFVTYRCILRLLSEYRKYINIKNHEINFTKDIDKNTQKINHINLQEDIINLEMEKAFPYDQNAKYNRINKIYRKLMQEHLIPKISNQKYKKLSQISNESGYSVCTLNKMISNKKMINLINKITN